MLHALNVLSGGEDEEIDTQENAFDLQKEIEKIGEPFNPEIFKTIDQFLLNQFQCSSELRLISTLTLITCNPILET